jgi:microsomal epoxide hydrolase
LIPFLEWADDPIAPDDILESVTLYWLTETFPRAIYAYPRAWQPSKLHRKRRKSKRLVYIPTGIIGRWDRWRLIDLRFETNAGLLQGGHFAALERPDELKADLVKLQSSPPLSNSYLGR